MGYIVRGFAANRTGVCVDDELDWDDGEEEIDFEERFDSVEECHEFVAGLEDAFDDFDWEIEEDEERDGDDEGIVDDGDDGGEGDNVGADLSFEKDYGLDDEWLDE